MHFFVPSFTSFKEGVQHNSLLGQSLWGLRLCEHQEIEAESCRTHFHQFLTRPLLLLHLSTVPRIPRVIIAGASSPSL